MPRPRSKDKVVPISIGIPSSLMIKLENILDFHHSRSRWVCDAIKTKLAYGKEQKKLAKTFDFDLIPTRSLLNLLFTRKIIDYDLITLLRTRVAEIEEQQ